MSNLPSCLFIRVIGCCAIAFAGFLTPRATLARPLIQTRVQSSESQAVLKSELVPLRHTPLTERSEYQFPPQSNATINVPSGTLPQGWTAVNSEKSVPPSSSLPVKRSDRLPTPTGQNAPSRIRNDQAANLALRRQDIGDGIESLPPPLVDNDEEGENVIKQRYPNGKPRIIRHVAQDENGNYYNHGPWEARDPTGQTLAQGAFVEGLMDGQWSRKHEKKSSSLFTTKPFDLFQGPFHSVAQFKKGKLQGNWSIYDRFQTKIFEINYEDGVRHGTATWFYPNTAKMREATFRRGLIDGEILEYDEAEQIADRQEYVKGRRIVRNTTFYRPNVKKTQEYFLDAKLEPQSEDNWWDAKPTPFVSTGRKTQNGAAMAWYDNGQPKKRGQFNDGQPVGQFTWWHANGNKQIEGFYIKGRKNRRWTWWFENGMKKFEGEFQNDQPIEIWQAWNGEGKLLKEKDYSVQAKLSDEDSASPSNPETEEDAQPDDETETVEPGSAELVSDDQSRGDQSANDPPPVDSVGGQIVDPMETEPTDEGTSEALPPPPSSESDKDKQQQMETIAPLEAPEKSIPVDAPKENSAEMDNHEIGTIPAELYQQKNNSADPQALSKIDNN